ncbi:fatty acid cis/trans isomerase [Sulfurimonas sp. CS5]|uniref:fatty acid cis/trans isomerase n=1 Tax=Sulfurimonas sp. CS5 TaxID=3391145 RepID=UPI0039EC1621
MNKYLLFISLIIIAFSGCSVEPLKPVKVDVPQARIDYLKEVKPILDKRCVVCHSCYNSPCQLKLSSFEGIDRGASKEKVYLGERLMAQDPSRLFIDAKDTKEWREKGFSSVLESDSAMGSNNSMMLLLLDHKMKNPQSKGEYFSESNDLTCSKDRDELAEFLDENPHSGMPFGFPPLSREEYKVIKKWLGQGAPAQTSAEIASSKTPSPNAQKLIVEFEKFLNNQDAKHVMSARYIYEHLFLSHIAFENAPGEFFELVRSSTPAPELINIIATIRPYDNPKVEKFYYRFKKIHSTIVYKTHMVYDLSAEKLMRYKELFIESKWKEKPHIVGYKIDYNAEPFKVFAQIPEVSRYKFLLDNSEYVIRTFIRGPVCKGQIALNVIRDNFWVMFMNPDYDLSIVKDGFLKQEYENLKMPIKDGSDVVVLDTFSDKYIDAAIKYNKNRQKLYDSVYKDGLNIDSIWKGDNAKSSPFLTVYRHFDSASLHKGALGGLPKTAWVIDYPLFERIYYALVAGFDVYGNVGHQISIRRYMSRLRVEGEVNFINLLPKEDREKLFTSWYLNAENQEEHFLSNNETAIKYEKVDSKRELIEKVVNTHLLKSCNIKFDGLNYMYANERVPNLPEHYLASSDYDKAFKSLVKKGLPFLKVVNGQQSNLAYIRIKNLPNSQDKVVSAVVNRWHDNVSFMFSEKDSLDTNKDEFDFIDGFIGSYPNLFLVVDYKDLPDFFDMLHSYDGSQKYIDKFLKYGVNRGDDDFWDTYDWFQERFYKDNPHEAGLFDLNRYYHKVFLK